MSFLLGYSLGLFLLLIFCPGLYLDVAGSGWINGS